jgi:peptide deformylase
MTIKDIVTIVDDQPTSLQDVSKIDVAVLETCRDMLETMQANNMEYITAPDIGSPYRILAIDGTIPSDGSLGVVVLINPSIVADQEDFVVVEFNDLAGAKQSLILVNVLREIVLHAINELV